MPLEQRQKILQKIHSLLDEKKAENIETFDLKDTDYFVDYVIIATALVDKHALSLLDTLKKELKACGEKFLHIDEENPDWIVADLGDILVHLFTENQRKKFNLEEFLITMQKKS
ncbi:MAG: ribosome silencing factor [Helicobacter sp.]|nr:ribosome silencing factor [Helicobacter sp.]